MRQPAHLRLLEDQRRRRIRIRDQMLQSPRIQAASPCLAHRDEATPGGGHAVRRRRVLRRS
eukprot:6153625-Lingulodinium_polyedra.AAC.1